MMNTACLTQIRYWSRANSQMEKAIHRKNKYINRLERENATLRKAIAKGWSESAERNFEDKNDGAARRRKDDDQWVPIDKAGRDGNA